MTHVWVIEVGELDCLAKFLDCATQRFAVELVASRDSKESGGSKDRGSVSHRLVRGVVDTKKAAPTPTFIPDMLSVALIFLKRAVHAEGHVFFTTEGLK